MIDLVAVGGTFFLSFWISIAIVILIEIGHDEGVLATWTLLGAILFCWVFTKISFIELFKENWKLIFLYLPLGLFWSIKMWYGKVSKMRDRYDEAKVSFLQDNGYAEGWVIKEEDKKEWLRKLYALDIEIPRADENKGDIIRWMAYWPWSVLNYLLWDLLVEIYERLFKLLKTMFQKISDNKFRDVKDDFKNEFNPDDRGSSRRV